MSLDDDFCVAIAHDGTIEGTTQHLDLKTRCYDEALQCARLDELKRDLEFVASPLVPQDTFWLGEGETQRCALEALALEIFRRHAAASPHAADPKSGVEWSFPPAPRSTTFSQAVRSPPPMSRLHGS